GADGHRQIVDGASYGVAGFGHSEGVAGACWPTFDVGDFGFEMPAPQKLAGAAPKPIGGGAGPYRIYATWADPALGAPSTIAAVIDGACTTMTKELGSPTLNATYFADVNLDAGCHAVYVLGRDASGARVTFPSTTAFTINVGGGACADETAQPQAACDNVAPPDLARPSANDGGSTVNPGDPQHGTGTPPTVQGGCAAAPGASSTAELLLIVFALALAARGVRSSTPRRRS